MKQEMKFYQTVWNIAVPVTLQSLLQSSFSVVDQIMIGQLGTVNIAGIGLAGKFASLYSVLLSAVAAVAGIMIAQYMGRQEHREVSRSFFVNLCLAAGIGVFFTAVCVFFPVQIMGLYTKDSQTAQIAGRYLRILAVSYLPMAAGQLLAVLLRCMEAAVIPLYAGICAAVINTALNYVLIFGKFGFPKMEADGAAAATVMAQLGNCFLIAALFLVHCRRKNWKLEVVLKLDRPAAVQYAGILLPVLMCEFLWSLGENVYASIYGHLGTDACAAMTLTTPVQVLFIGALSGLAQASGVIIGKTLGKGEYDRAYRESEKLMGYGLAGSAVLSVCLFVCSRYYVQIYQVKPSVMETAVHILTAFALIAPVKVINMILGGGIIRSGGKTRYIMWTDIAGTWGFGVPLGLLAAFVWKLSIPYVYFILSLEECVRLGISLMIFHKKVWMRSLPEAEGPEQEKYRRKQAGTEEM